jgi:hypothetical protein
MKVARKITDNSEIFTFQKKGGGVSKGVDTISLFSVGATFEMRTVLYGICLLIEKLKIHDRVFISNNLIMERGRHERDKKRESVRDNALLKMRDSVGNKIDCWRKY